MYRRTFLKACGLSGLLYASNWATVARGPKPGDVVKRGVFKVISSDFAIAGEQLRAGDAVYCGRDGKMYRATVETAEKVSGIAIHNRHRGQPSEIATQGWVSLDA